MYVTLFECVSLCRRIADLDGVDPDPTLEQKPDPDPTVKKNRVLFRLSRKKKNSVSVQDPTANI